MLKEAKKALRVTVDNFDDEIMRLCMAGYDDLKIAGVIETGTVSFTESTSGAVTDTSTLADNWCMRAIITYVKMNFGNPPNQEWLQQSYETQLGQLMTTSGYTNFGDDDSVATE